MWSGVDLSSADVVDIRWDVFLSYARRDHGEVRPIAESLHNRGLRVFVDEAAVNDFDSISQVIRRELASSLALLAFYSESYPTRRACQWELTVAYLAGQREGAAHRRVLVINPEADSDHIHPVELRDARHWSVPSAELLPTFADRVAEHVATLVSPIGQVETLTPVRWLPAPPRLGSPAFVGRLPHLWRLHSALHPHAAPLLTGRTAASAVVLRGRPNTGKTLLVEEYAVRFSATFPGGVFWLNLDYDSDPLPAYARQVRTICTALRLPVTGSLDDALSNLAVELERRGQPCLWVVDGVPADLPPGQVRMFFAPHPVAATVLTTRGSYSHLATPIDLNGAPVDYSADRPLSTMSLSETERAAAFDLQVELATRVGVQSLAKDSGGLREALASLHSLFGATRLTLHHYGPDAGAAHVIAAELLNDILRPFLTRWHGELAAYEERREPAIGAWEHEHLWPAAAEFRAELARLNKPLNQVVAKLARVSGTDLGL
jgi:hypothetical protein